MKLDELSMPTLDAAPGSVPGTEPGSARRALYRTWRAQKFGDLIGQDPIVTTLRNAVETSRLSHAYLFVGPRGTGKTSTARLLAKAINCTALEAGGDPCDRCAACVAIRDGRAMDVIEIDAASHGLVEDARDLVMRALTAPSALRRRVYIIDEVHMLSTHAFNALLKLIEEPPDHVVFILATTDTHKVPPTIISRTQRFDFRRLPVELIVSKLVRICAAEGIAADPEALALVARLADGAMRDAESLLDQVLAYAGGELTLSAVRDAVGLADDETVTALVDALVAGDGRAAIDLIAQLSDAGREMTQVATQATDDARRRLFDAAANPGAARALAVVLRGLADAAGAAGREGRARLALELLAVERSLDGGREAPVEAARETPPRETVVAAVRVSAPTPAARTTPPAATTTTATSDAAPRKRAARPPTDDVAEPVAAAAPAADEPVAAAAAPATEPPAAAEPSAAAEPPAARSLDGPPTLEAVRARWGEVVERATPVVRPLLKESRPIAIDGARLTLAFPEGRDFMRSRMTARRQSIEELLTTLFGGRWTLECVVASVELEPLSIGDAVAPDATDPQGRVFLETVLQMTGGELLDAGEVH